MTSARPFRRRSLALIAVGAALSAVGCERDPDPDVIPRGSGWECVLDVCQRACDARLRLGSPTSSCEPRRVAYCMTWVDGASDKPMYYCASSRAYCEDIHIGHKNGVLGEEPARRVSRCLETR